MKCYSIGKTVFAIESEYVFEKYDIMEKYSVSDPENIDYYYYFSFCEEIPAQLGELVSDGELVKVFKKGKLEIRVYTFSDAVGDFAYSVYEEGSNKMNIYLCREKEIAYRRRGIILELIQLEKMLLKKNGLILHASSICVKEKSILFCAPSQTGKSTQAYLWNKYRGAEILNGDRALFIKEDDQWFQYGIPACGTSGISENKKVPVAGIIFVEQGKENVVSELSHAQYYKRLYAEMILNRWDINYMRDALEMIDEMIHEIPMYKMACRPDEEAVQILEKWMKVKNLAK